MIVGSLLLILAAVVSLVVGLVRGSNALLICSIAASLLAAIVLIAGARRSAARRAAAGRASNLGGLGVDDTLAGQPDAPTMRDRPDTPLRKATAKGPGPGVRAGAYGAPDGVAEGGTLVDETPTQVFIPSQSRQGAAPGIDRDGLDDDGGYDDEDPPDEPVAQVVSPQDAARVAQMSTEVLVIDGRPRYHHPTCVHLLGRENEPLPVSEAVELGFTPCGLCEPDAAMLAEARRA